MRLILQAVFGFFAFWITLSCSSSEGAKFNENDFALTKLKEAAHSENFWVKIHAHEFLLQLGYSEWADSSFNSWSRFHKEVREERIGIWRLGYMLTRNAAEKDQWLQKIQEAYLNPDGPDRIHAAETLSKLNIPLRSLSEERLEKDLLRNDLLSGFAIWGAALGSNTEEKPCIDFILDAIDTADILTKETLAYALIKIDTEFSANEMERIETLSKDPELSDLAKKRLELASFSGERDPSLKMEKYHLVKNLIKSDHRNIRYEACEMMAHYGDAAVEPDLKSIISGQNKIEDIPVENEYQNLDCQSAAAFAFLSLGRSSPDTLSILDWIVIALFLLWMIGIGFYYSKRSKNKEDYLLGGRNMNPFMVGLSLFATLLSTLSYLAYPGEMIKYGPIVFFGLLSFPVAYWIVSRFLIPKFMELNVTSAYEILEIRLGGRTRNLGTLFFLLLRFLWMSTIIYATVNIALIHVMGFSEKWIPIVCIIIALITVFYTALGGIKAVVMTDAVQSFVLLGGAVLSIVLISFQFDSPFEWFPRQWLSHWEPLNWRINMRQRMTIGNIFIMTLVWQVCTAGSDQMAIQRYLSTRNVKDARTTLKVSLISSATVQLILALLGLAIASYFLRFPQNLPMGTDVYKNADSLFPGFIVTGLPTGISGLVVAGIMAAAMSSLSSGLNSSSSVLSEDVLDRHFPQLFGSTDSLRKVRLISIFLGLIVSVCSAFVGFIEGNLLDVVIKVVNLVVAPLFVLFFMALFVPGATDRGTFFAGIFSLVVAILIAFYGLFHLSVLMIMPVALVSGILAGIVMSKFI